MTDPNDLPPEIRETPVDAAVAARVADDAEVGADALAETLAVVDADLRGRHSAFEADCEYVTVDGRRAYFVDEGAWDGLIDDVADEATAEAVVRAHARQARLLADESVENPKFDGAGVVIGVDTAEEMT